MNIKDADDVERRPVPSGVLSFDSLFEFTKDIRPPSNDCSCDVCDGLRNCANRVPRRHGLAPCVHCGFVRNIWPHGHRWWT